MTVVLGACTSSGNKVETRTEAQVTTTALDRVAAEAAIREAYATFANPHVTDAERSEANEIITDPAVLAWGAEMSAKHLAGAEGVSFVVDAIAFTSDTTADVDYHILYGAGPSPVVPNESPGGAVFEDGHWRVTHATGCFLDSMIGERCPDQYLTPEQLTIGHPFANLARSDLTDDERVADVERGDEIRDFILAVAQKYAGFLGHPLTVLAVRHARGASDAEVWYTEGSVQPGSAVLDRGRWTVSRATWCQLTFNFSGLACPQ